MLKTIIFFYSCIYCINFIQNYSIVYFVNISGCFLLTQKDRYIPVEDASHILAAIGYEGKLPEKKENGRNYVNVKDIFSTLLPKDLNLEYKAKTCFNC